MLAYADIVNAMGPLVLYQFNDATPTVAADSSGNGNPGAYVGDAGLVAGRDGAGTALKVNGAGAMTVNNAATELASISANNRITVSFWLQNDPNNPRNSTAFSGVPASGRLQAHVTWSDNNIYWDAGLAWNGSAANRQVVPLGVAGSNQLKADWNHLAFVKDGVADTTSIYLNGTLLATANGSTDNLGAITAFYLGSTNNLSEGHTGKFDDFALFDRALTAAEIDQLADRAPTPAVIASGASVTEGGSLALSLATASTDPDGGAVTYAWDVNGDGNFTDAAGANPVLNWTQLEALGISDGPATLNNVRVRATDAVGQSTDSAAASVNITNAAPTGVVITAPASANLLEEVMFTFQLLDPSSIDANDPAQMPDVDATFTVDWGDGSAPEVVAGPANGATATHIYESPGPKTISVVGRDKDNASTATASTKSISISNVGTDLDGNLVVMGTEANDRIVLSLSGGIQVRLNNRLLGRFSSDEKVIIHGLEGNDTISLGGAFPVKMEVYGGEGNDYISGGSANDTLVGGAGNDRLLAGAGDDLLYGGELEEESVGSGNDTLSGGVGSDTLYGGDGVDNINGDVGDDVVYGENGNDKISGGAGSDLIRGGAGTNHLDGGAGNDILVGGDGTDRMYGQAGRDMLLGGDSLDYLYGGADDDLIVADASIYDEENEFVLRALLDDFIAGDTSGFSDATIPGPYAPDNIYGQVGADIVFHSTQDRLLTRNSTDEYNNVEDPLP